MSNASQRNFAAAVGERDRRQARINEGEDPIGLAQAAYLGPGWDAFFGSLHDQADAAHAAGMGYQVSLGGLGRMPDEGASGGGLNPLELDSLKNQGLSQNFDAAVQQARAQQLHQQAINDAQEQERINDLHRSYAEQTQASAMAPPLEPTAVSISPNGEKLTAKPAGTPTEQMLARMNPIDRAKATAALSAAKLATDKLAETTRHNQATEHAADDDVKSAVRGMADGTLPPQLPGRASKEYVALLGEAKRQGYDLAKASTDWMATQKHIATMNGAQQLRLNQAINTLPDMLDSVDTLASQWKAGKFPLLNKANLALAKNGAYGKDAASIAVRLDAQIADVTADLGNVYMGGNSPTDHALGLAGKNLNSNWDEQVLHDAVAQARENVKYRRNSILNTGVAGASPTNPYATQTPAVSGTAEEWVRDANGKLVKKGKS